MFLWGGVCNWRWPVEIVFFLCDHFSEIDFILLGGIELTKPITSEKAVMNFHLRGAFNLSSYVKPKTISFLSSLLLRDQQNWRILPGISMFRYVFFQFSIEHATWVAASCFERAFNPRFMFLPWSCLPSATFPFWPSSSYESPGTRPWGPCWGLQDSNILKKGQLPLGAAVSMSLGTSKIIAFLRFLVSPSNLTITHPPQLRGISLNNQR